MCTVYLHDGKFSWFGYLAFFKLNIFVVIPRETKTFIDVRWGISNESIIGSFRTSTRQLKTNLNLKGKMFHFKYFLVYVLQVFIYSESMTVTSERGITQSVNVVITIRQNDVYDTFVYSFTLKFLVTKSNIIWNIFCLYLCDNSLLDTEIWHLKRLRIKMYEGR